MRVTSIIAATATWVVVNATPAVVKRYGNETTSDITSFPGTAPTGWQTVPIGPPSNATGTTSANVSVIVTTAVSATTLTYTLGPEGSSSVVTTVIENTSTITTTSTLYVTVTEPGDEPPDGSGSTATATGGLPPIYTPIPVNGTATDSLTATDEPTDTSAPTASETDSGSSENTVTITSYLTTTETITMETIPTGASGDSGFSSASNPDNHVGNGSHWPHHGHGGCSVMTVTSTVVEESTVTVTPTDSGNVPIDPTATPSYTYGNGTDTTTGFPTASSGFLTFMRRSRPTKL